MAAGFGLSADATGATRGAGNGAVACAPAPRAVRPNPTTVNPPRMHRATMVAVRDDFASRPTAGAPISVTRSRSPASFAASLRAVTLPHPLSPSAAAEDLARELLELL